MDIREGVSNHETSAKPFKFNFKVKEKGSRQQSEKKDASKTPRKHIQATDKNASTGSNQKDKEANAKKKMVNMRHLNQLRQIAYGSSKRKEPQQNEINSS